MKVQSRIHAIRLLIFGSLCLGQSIIAVQPTKFIFKNNTQKLAHMNISNDFSAASGLYHSVPLIPLPKAGDLTEVSTQSSFFDPKNISFIISINGNTYAMIIRTIQTILSYELDAERQVAAQRNGMWVIENVEHKNVRFKMGDTIQISVEGDGSRIELKNLSTGQNLMEQPHVAPAA